MSAPLAGKFQDHYEVLEIDPHASVEEIKQAYARLAERYNPNSFAYDPEEIDEENFEALKQALEVLTDEDLRREFDKLKGIEKEKTPTFDGEKFFDGLGREAGLRAALLSILYDRRKKMPYTPSLSMRHLDTMLSSTSEELYSVLWYLKAKDLVSQDDKSSLQITVQGIDYLEANRPSRDLVMPFISEEALANPAEEEQDSANAGPEAAGSGAANPTGEAADAPATATSNAATAPGEEGSPEAGGSGDGDARGAVLEDEMGLRALDRSLSTA